MQFVDTIQPPSSKKTHPPPPGYTSFSSLPFLRLHSLTPRSTSARVTPLGTSQNTTPNPSTFRFRRSSSKNNISSYATPPLCFWIRAKCVFLSPGNICT